MTLAERLVRLCIPWLPPHLRDWGEAMTQEVRAIPSGVQALLFAMGCVAFSARVGVCAWARKALQSASTGKRGGIRTAVQGLGEPRGFALACGVLATTMGLAHLAATAAPSGMLIMNAMALVAGGMLVLPVWRNEPADRPFFAFLSLGTGAVLLLTAIFGEQTAGAARWLSMGQIVLQPSLVLLPLIVVGFARTRDALTAFGIAVSAIALALQPDRAMAGALLAGLAAMTIFARDPRTLFCLAVAGLAFAVTCIRPDAVSATPYVDGVFRTAFSNGIIPGLAVWGGAVILLLPAARGIIRDRPRRAVHAASGATWCAVLAAAASADFPTPLVGYGGSAIVGYTLATLALPRRWSETAVTALNCDCSRTPEREPLRVMAALNV